MQGNPERKPKHRADEPADALTELFANAKRVCVCDPDRQHCHPNPLTECVNRGPQPDTFGVTHPYTLRDLAANWITGEPGESAVGGRA
jgi:hypothetical protein